MEDAGKLLLRFTCAGLLLPHGAFKVFVEIDSVRQMVGDAGLPPVLAYGTIIGEVIAPIFLLLGWRTRIAALIVAFNMLMTIVIAHRDSMFRLNDYWGLMIELNVFFLFISIVIALLGAGRLSLSKGSGKWD